MNRPLFEEDAQNALLAGAEKVYKAVSCTLGARGRNVAIHKWGRPRITNDGVSVARSIELENPAERMGADLLKEAAEKTNSEGGDGTTTSIVLAYTLFQKGLELIKRGHNPMVLRKQIEIESEKVLERLKEMAIPVDSDEDLEKIATISVESPVYGKIIADAIKAAGKDGQVIVEEDNIPGVRKEEVAGYKFDRGWENPYLVTDPNKMEAVLYEKDGRPIPVLVADKTWNLITDLGPLCDSLKSNGHDKLLIITEEISGELLKFFVVNRMKLLFHAVVVKCPFNKDMLEDIASLTGATAITADKGIVEVLPEHLGYAQKVIVTEKKTIIVDGKGDSTEKIESLRSQIEIAEKEGEGKSYETGKLRDRLSALTGKTVIVRVGASTDAESKYLKDKIDDGVGATQAAVEEGIVAGGGMALARIAHSEVLSDLMRDVLKSPALKIIENSGHDTENAKDVLKEVLESPNGKAGFNALSGETAEDILSEGVIDPVKVTRCAFKNAISLASMLLTTDAVVFEVPEKPSV